MKQQILGSNIQRQKLKNKIRIDYCINRLYAYFEMFSMGSM